MVPNNIATAGLKCLLTSARTTRRAARTALQRVAVLLAKTAGRTVTREKHMEVCIVVSVVVCG